jgi:small subunit ribosomal protein S3Ae
MTAGKSKRVPKGKSKKKTIDTFAKKEWYDVLAPPPFKNRDVCKTTINKTAGTRIATDMIKGRVFEASVADLMNDEDQSHQIVKLRVEEVKDRAALTQFHGMRFTTDKARSLVKKWHTLITTYVDAKTSDGYVVRVFAVAITKRRQLQLKKTCYAKKSQVDRITAKMKEILGKTITTSDTKTLTEKIIFNIIGGEMEKKCAFIYPLQTVHVCKVKVLKYPKADSAKLKELYQL